MPNISYTSCPICKAENFESVFYVKDYTVSGREFEIVHCKSCGVRLTQNVPGENEIGAYYKSADYISHNHNSKGLISQLYRKVRNYTVKQKAGIIKKYTKLSEGSLLDIGCGTGAFIYTMAQLRWNVTGLEPDADARNTAKALYGIETLSSDCLFSLPADSFNAITLWHVLEHVHRLHENVAQMKRLLTKDGVIFIAVPNYTCQDARVYGKYWAGYDVPRHLYHFSPHAMEVLMQQHNLKVVKKLPMWFDSFYVDMLSSKYKNGSVHYIAAGMHGLMSNINALRKREECCSLIYVVK
ncbi:MAG: class I SAM-dependent methyltransferase [Chitinophagaceae bacterium]|nr:class I SAM-dependent methyltransferase [Chitinophagaceae bacterium]